MVFIVRAVQRFENWLKARGTKKQGTQTIPQAGP
jgi:hypothetical protein